MEHEERFLYVRYINTKANREGTKVRIEYVDHIRQDLNDILRGKYFRVPARFEKFKTFPEEIHFIILNVVFDDYKNHRYFEEYELIIESSDSSDCIRRMLSNINKSTARNYMKSGQKYIKAYAASVKVNEDGKCSDFRRHQKPSKNISKDVPKQKCKDSGFSTKEKPHNTERRKVRIEPYEKPIYIEFERIIK